MQIRNVIQSQLKFTSRIYQKEIGHHLFPQLNSKVHLLRLISMIYLSFRDSSLVNYVNSNSSLIYTSKMFIFVYVYITNLGRIFNLRSWLKILCFFPL